MHNNIVSMTTYAEETYLMLIMFIKIIYIYIYLAMWLYCSKLNRVKADFEHNFGNIMGEK